MNKTREFTQYIKTTKKRFKISLFGFPLLSLLFFCYAIVPGFPGEFGRANDVIYIGFESAPRILAFAYCYLITHPFELLFIVFVIMAPLIYFLYRRKFKYAYVILVLVVNMSGPLCSYIAAKTILLNCGLGIVSLSATPLILTIEKYHHDNGKYPDSLRFVNQGYSMFLLNMSNRKGSLEYNRTEDNGYKLRIDLQPERFCTVRDDTCSYYALEYHPSGFVKVGCDVIDELGYTCIRYLIDNWYVVISYNEG